MDALIAKLRELFPDLQFTAGRQFYWSPETAEIFYNAAAKDSQAIWSLLHETGHALLGHTAYKADYKLLRLEIAAWERAKNLAGDLGIAIDEEHIEDCLDTYRDWVHKRSICPNCNIKCLQQGDFVHYRCFNCHTTWKVSANRFCRSYRRTQSMAQPKAIS